MRKEIYFIFVLFFAVLFVQTVSAEKTWSFHNHSLNVSHNIELAGNLTTTDTGFFSYLGNLANRNEVLK